jgi:hypothetical protein
MNINRIAKWIGVATLFAGVVNGEPVEASAGELMVAVYVSNDQKIPVGHLAKAESIADGIFSEAGVRLRWKLGTAQRNTAAQEGDCARHPIAIQIDFVSGLPGGLSSKALAQTHPYSQDGLRIDVFADRLGPMFRSRPLQASAQLAHILAHEITHLLQGIGRHSENGLMRARWSQDDYDQMSSDKFGFEPIDVTLIRTGMANRSRSCAAKNLAAR